MRLFLIFASLTLAATPALARPGKAPQGKRVDRFTKAKIVKARAERDYAIEKLDLKLAKETARARAKYCGDRYRFQGAKARLEVWYDKRRASIQRKFQNRRDAILADSRTGTDRRLAKIRAKRDRDLREIDSDLAAELRRANGKYAGRPYELRAAQRRLDRWAERRRTKVREVFRRDRAKILRS